MSAEPVPATCGTFIGMDEAGYGPNLGPLLIATTRWQTPADPARCDFYKTLRAAASVKPCPRGSKLHLADSKVVNQGKSGFLALETSALALLQCLNLSTASFQSLWQCLSAPATSSTTPCPPMAPWYADDLALPAVACPDHIQHLSQKLRKCMQQSGVHLQQVRVDLVVEERFNQLLSEPAANKGQLLSQLAFKLLRSVWEPGHAAATLIVADKHGGRNRYDELLAQVLDGEMIFRLEEGQQLSRYRVGRCELRFQVGGEAHLPVACASLIAKYLREVSMRLFNRFWQTHCPHVKPTLGYPNDARRFREQVDATRALLQIEEHHFWRSR